MIAATGVLQFRATGKTEKVETLNHGEASRKNIPTAEYQAVMEQDDRSPIRLAYQRRNRDLDPQQVRTFVPVVAV